MFLHYNNQFREKERERKREIERERERELCVIEYVCTRFDAARSSGKTPSRPPRCVALISERAVEGSAMEKELKIATLTKGCKGGGGEG